MRTIQKQIIYITKEESETLMKALKLVEDIANAASDPDEKSDLAKCHNYLCNVWNLVEVELK